jgi:hypothetical protein
MSIGQSGGSEYGIRKLISLNVERDYRHLRAPLASGGFPVMWSDM